MSSGSRSVTHLYYDTTMTYIVPGRCWVNACYKLHVCSLTCQIMRQTKLPTFAWVVVPSLTNPAQFVWNVVCIPVLVPYRYDTAITENTSFGPIFMNLWLVESCQGTIMLIAYTLTLSSFQHQPDEIEKTYGSYCQCLSGISLDLQPSKCLCFLC